MIKLNGYFGEIELLYDNLKKQLAEQEIIIVEKSSWDELSACMHGKIKSKTHKPQGKIEEIKVDDLELIRQKLDNLSVRVFCLEDTLKFKFGAIIKNREGGVEMPEPKQIKQLRPVSSYCGIIDNDYIESHIKDMHKKIEELVDRVNEPKP